MKAAAIILMTTILSFQLSCNSAKKSNEAMKNEPMQGTYVIAMLQQKNVTDKAMELTFKAEDSSFSGKTECNSMFGTYKAEGDKITFAPVGATKMYCEGKMEAEKTIQKMLGEATHYTSQKGKISFYNADDTLLLSASKK